jgi:hypothetical protein
VQVLLDELAHLHHVQGGRRQLQRALLLPRLTDHPHLNIVLSRKMVVLVSGGLATLALLRLALQELPGDGHLLLDWRCERGAGECALALLAADAPLDPLEAPHRQHVAAPEELQHCVAQLQHEHLPQPHEAHHVHLRFVRDQHVLLPVAAQLLAAQSQYFALLAEGVGELGEAERPAVVVEEAVVGEGGEGGLVVEDHSEAAVGEQVADAVLAGHVVVADDVVAVLLVPAGPRGERGGGGVVAVQLVAHASIEEHSLVELGQVAPTALIVVQLEGVLVAGEHAAELGTVAVAGVGAVRLLAGADLARVDGQFGALLAAVLLQEAALGRQGNGVGWHAGRDLLVEEEVAAPHLLQRRPAARVGVQQLPDEALGLS